MIPDPAISILLNFGYFRLTYKSFVPLHTLNSVNPPTVVCKRMLLGPPEHLYCIWHAVVSRNAPQDGCYICHWPPQMLLRCVSACLPYDWRWHSTSDAPPFPPHTHGSPSTTPQEDKHLLPRLISQMPQTHMRNGVRGMDIFNSW